MKILADVSSGPIWLLGPAIIWLTIVAAVLIIAFLVLTIKKIAAHRKKVKNSSEQERYPGDKDK